MSNDNTTDTTTTTASSSSSGSTESAASSASSAETMAPPPPDGAVSKVPPSQASQADLRADILERKRKEREAALEKEKASCVEFLYSGPHTHVTFAAGYEVQLTPDTVVKLPPDEEYTKGLVDRGYATRKSDADKTKARSRARKGVN